MRGTTMAALIILIVGAIGFLIDSGAALVGKISTDTHDCTEWNAGSRSAAAWADCHGDR